MTDNDTPKTTRDVDDISLEDVRPARKGGPGLVLPIVLLLVVLGLLGWLLNHQKEVKRIAAEKVQAASTRQAALDVIAGQVAQTLAAAQAGDVTGALNTLGIIETKLGDLIGAANSVGDTDAANEIMTKKQYVIDARKVILEEQTRFQGVVTEKLNNLRAAFGVSAAATPAPDTSAVPNPEAPISPEVPQVVPAPDASAVPAPAPDAGTVPVAPDATVVPVPAAPDATAVPAAPAVPAPAN